MSELIAAVREVMGNATQMNVSTILRNIQKSNTSSVKTNKEELLEALNHYKNLQIIYLDEDENVVFL